MKFNEFKKQLDKINSRTVSSAQIENKENLDLILDIVKTINKSLILDDVLTHVLEKAIELTSTDRGFIVLQNPQGKLEYKLGLNNSGTILPEELFEISTTVIEDVFELGKSSFIESALTDTGNDPSKSIIRLELQTILCSPLVCGDSKIGVIYVDCKSLRKVKVKEITSTFEILAGQAAIAIQNAQLYNEQLKAYSALKEANEKLRLAKDEAEKSNRLKSQFLAQMSHEIRTPINIIFGFTSLLREDFEPEQVVKHQDTFESIMSAGKRIMNTIDTILEMSQIQTGTMEYTPVLLNLSKDVLFYLYKEFKLLSDTKGLKLNFIYAAENKCIRADKYMVKQIFSKILDNAIKYTDKGSVILHVYNEENKVCVDIEDTGIGISENYLKLLYAPFSQEEMGYTRKFDGNGLSLAIAKKYIEVNNAEIYVTSTKQKGTKFTVKFENC